MIKSLVFGGGYGIAIMFLLDYLGFGFDEIGFKFLLLSLLIVAPSSVIIGYSIAVFEEKTR